MKRSVQQSRGCLLAHHSPSLCVRGLMKVNNKWIKLWEVIRVKKGNVIKLH